MSYADTEAHIRWNVVQEWKWKELNQGMSEDDMVGWYQRGYEKKFGLSWEDALSSAANLRVDV